MSSKFYRELVACCVREGATHPRLELFGMLCGFPLPNLLNAKYDAAKCSFFFQILSVVFDRNVEKMKEAFLNFVSLLFPSSRLCLSEVLMFPLDGFIDGRSPNYFRKYSHHL